MKLDLRIRITITLFLFLLATLTTLAQPMARPGCETECGGITIPFPFGMEQGCYIEESFRISCNNSTNNRPFLNGVNLQVLEISARKSTIQASFPIAYTDCGGRNSSSLLDLHSTPFVFSTSENTFTAVGCNNLALITQNGSSAGGCMSICDDNNDVSNVNVTCDGINCCQTRVPTDLKIFNATLSGVNDERGNGTGQQCKFAYIVNQTWLEHSGFNPYTVQDAEYVPVVLSWTIDARIFSSFADISLGSNFTRASLCRASNSTISSDQSVQCYCNLGFQGNPYLRSGCGDVDECAGPENPCSKQKMKCTNLYGSFRCYSPSPRAKMITLGLSVGFGSLLFVIGSWWSYKALKRRRMKKLKEKFFKRNGGLLLQEQLSSGEVSVENIKMFSSKELDKATDHYNPNRTLGQGGQGTVYKGMLTDGRIVAVKKSEIVGEEKLRQFINEVIILSQINHRNVVKLLGCCMETQVPMLVYEFIPNGNLSEFLHNQNDEIPSTSWDMRLRIALEIAGALSYLHSSASMPIYHRDIKSTNILLDDKYRAKIADFGISRTVSVDHTHVTTTVQGTFGYLDPEYFRSSQFTDKSDVYSFGVVLVELLTGQKPISQTRSEEIRGLVSYFFQAMEEKRLFDILDVQIMTQDNEEDLIAVANLAKRCLSMTGKLRPSMKEVTMELEVIQKLHHNLNYSQYDATEMVEVECNRHEAMDQWDVFSTSTTDTASSLEKKPILPKH